MAVSPRSRVGTVLTTLVGVLVALASLTVMAAVRLGHEATVDARGGLTIRRADQLGRAAVAEAMRAVEGEANEPSNRWKDPRAADTARDPMLDAWFRRLHADPPGGTAEPPRLDRPVRVPVPRVAALAAREGLAVSDVDVWVAARTTDGLLTHGSIDARVVVRGGRGPWVVSRTLEERRVFTTLAWPSGLQAPTVSECRILPGARGRVHGVP